jgi:MoaA/NifB/PqqE/SkfB family radical SAM enzyme
MPEKADIKIKFSCNNKCFFCVQGDKRTKFKDKTLKHIQQELLQGKNAGGRAVVFTGGEPALHKEILKLVECARKMGYQSVQIQTNGRMFYYKSFCKDMIKAGVTEFCPALHGSNETLHDYLTNSQGAFRQTVKGILNLKSLGAAVFTNSVITEPSRKDLPKLGRLLTALDVDCYQFAFPHLLGSAYKNRKWLIPRKSKLKPWLHRGLDFGIKAGKNVTTEAIPYCFMQGYEDCIAERYMPNAVVFDAYFKVDDFRYYRLNKGKMKGPNCHRCIYFKTCEGPWVEYPQLFGWSEFKPVVK